MKANKPLRSLLYVPGNKARMLEKAKSLAPDVINFDLEDGVAPGEKETARRMVAEAFEAGPYTTYPPHPPVDRGTQVAVRPNAFFTGLTEADLRETIKPGVDMVLFPKKNTPEEIGGADSLLAGLERERNLPAGSVKMLVMVETALGVLNAYPIARASERILALCFGAEDFTSDMGAIRSKGGAEIAYARAHLVLAARAAGVLAVDMPYTGLTDDEGFLQETRSIREIGFSGKLLIHPKQIDLAHQAFAPSAEEIAYARRVVEAFEAAEAQGTGAIALDGQMIDAPVVARAREILSNSFKQPSRS